MPFKMSCGEAYDSKMAACESQGALRLSGWPSVVTHATVRGVICVMIIGDLILKQKID